MDNFFQSSDKKVALRDFQNFRNFRETENQIEHFCQFFQKETLFLVKCQIPVEECPKKLGYTFHRRHTYIR